MRSAQNRGRKTPENGPGDTISLEKTVAGQQDPDAGERLVRRHGLTV
jgi:hypothetical protein